LASILACKPLTDHVEDPALTSHIDLEQARFNMVEQQVRPWEVLDPRVLDVLSTVPREQFVPERYRNLAFGDLRIPLACGQSMMRPVEEGRLLQALQLTAVDTVLEIGTGSGFVTACLATLAQTVVSVELFEDLHQSAGAKLSHLGIDNVILRIGDAAHGWQEEHLFDAIAITGSMAALPDVYKTLVKPGGRLFVVTGGAPAMEARLLTRSGEHAWREESLFETDLPPLVNAEQKPEFVL
jgi:protein-L-isoaspartate(D-aspartate) O-methyltransferase